MCLDYPATSQPVVSPIRKSPRTTPRKSYGASTSSPAVTPSGRKVSKHIVSTPIRNRDDSVPSAPTSTQTTPSTTPMKEGKKPGYHFTDADHENILIWFKENEVLWKDSEHYRDPRMRENVKREKIKEFPGLTYEKFETYLKTTRTIFTNTSKELDGKTGSARVELSSLNRRKQLVMEHYPIDSKSVTRRDRGTSSLKVCDMNQ